jgi:hypothetical protein
MTRRSEILLLGLAELEAYERKLLELLASRVDRLAVAQEHIEDSLALLAQPRRSLVRRNASFLKHRE